jgi:hypothetical protein
MESATWKRGVYAGASRNRVRRLPHSRMHMAPLECPVGRTIGAPTKAGMESEEGMAFESLPRRGHLANGASELPPYGRSSGSSEFTENQKPQVCQACAGAVSFPTDWMCIRALAIKDGCLDSESVYSNGKKPPHFERTTHSWQGVAYTFFQSEMDCFAYFHSDWRRTQS